MKTTRSYFSFCTMAFFLVFVSCSKEELYEPIATEETQSTNFKAPQNTLRITMETKKVNYDYLYPTKTVVFEDQVWYVSEKRSASIPYTFTNQLWSSEDGVQFELRNSTAVPEGSLVAFNDKLWIIGDKVWNSENGKNWSIVPLTNSLRHPFRNTSGSGIVVFNGKMFLFEENPRGDQRVFSSSNGSVWHLENANAFPSVVLGRPIVYNNKLYYVGGNYYRTPNPTNDIYQSTNGRDWSKLNRGLTPYPDTTVFGPRSWFGMTLFENKVWVIGGSTGGHTPPDNEIWYSSDMKRWTKYEGNVPFGWMTGHTAITFNNKILIMGGFGESRYIDDVDPLKKIWSIQPGGRLPN